MDEEDWLATPCDTNINESSHPHTNAHTGIGLSILSSIDLAYTLDKAMEEKVSLAETNGILPNHLNTAYHRLHNNQLRKDRRAKSAAARRAAENDISSIDDSIRDTAAHLKDLREQKKTVQQQTGIKTQRKVTSRTKASFTDPTNSEPVTPAVDSSVGVSLTTGTSSSPVTTDVSLSRSPMITVQPVSVAAMTGSDEMALPSSSKQPVDTVPRNTSAQSSNMYPYASYPAAPSYYPYAYNHPYYAPYGYYAPPLAVYSSASTQPSHPSSHSPHATSNVATSSAHRTSEK